MKPTSLLGRDGALEWVTYYHQGKVIASIPQTQETPTGYGMSENMNVDALKEELDHLEVKLLEEQHLLDEAEAEAKNRKTWHHRKILGKHQDIVRSLRWEIFQKKNEIKKHTFQNDPRNCPAYMDQKDFKASRVAVSYDGTVHLHICLLKKDRLERHVQSVATAIRIEGPVSANNLKILVGGSIVQAKIAIKHLLKTGEIRAIDKRGKRHRKLFESTRVLGINLGAPGYQNKTVADDVRRIFLKYFGNQVQKAGLDPYEVLSDVYRKILVANRGNHPFNPEKSSFGHYIHMVCQSALRNYLKKNNRYSNRIVFGTRNQDGDLEDVGSMDIPSPPEQEMVDTFNTMKKKPLSYLKDSKRIDFTRDMANRISSLRKGKSWSQPYLAKQAGINLVVLRRLEESQTKTAQVEVLKRLEDCLESPVVIL